MADRTSVPTEVFNVGNKNLPDWLRGKTDESLEILKQHVVLPRIKVVQAQSSSELSEKFGIGGVILSPSNTLVARIGEVFDIVPIFFWVEYLKWADIKDNDSNSIMEQSLDPNSDVARCCLNPALRKEEYGGGFEATYKETLSFACYIYGDHPLAGTQCALNFSGGEYTNGKAFISAISLRGAPLWANIFSMKSAHRPKGAFNWVGIDYSDGPRPFIEESEAEFMREQHVNLTNAYKERKISSDYSGELGTKAEDISDNEDISEI